MVLRGQAYVIRSIELLTLYSKLQQVLSQCRDRKLNRFLNLVDWIYRVYRAILRDEEPAATLRFSSGLAQSATPQELRGKVLQSHSPLVPRLAKY